MKQPTSVGKKTIEYLKFINFLLKLFFVHLKNDMQKKYRIVLVTKLD